MEEQEASPEGEREHQAGLERPGGTAASGGILGANSPDDQINASACLIGTRCTS